MGPDFAERIGYEFCVGGMSFSSHPVEPTSVSTSISLNQGFSTLVLLKLGADHSCLLGAVLGTGGYFSSGVFAGLHPLDASSTTQNGDTPKCLQTLPDVLWGVLP